jgi:hypothetical protein
VIVGLDPGGERGVINAYISGGSHQVDQVARWRAVMELPCGVPHAYLIGDREKRPAGGPLVDRLPTDAEHPGDSRAAQRSGVGACLPERAGHSVDGRRHVRDVGLVTECAAQLIEHIVDSTHEPKG